MEVYKIETKPKKAKDSTPESPLAITASGRETAQVLATSGSDSEDSSTGDKPSSNTSGTTVPTEPVVGKNVVLGEARCRHWQMHNQYLLSANILLRGTFFVPEQEFSHVNADGLRISLFLKNAFELLSPYLERSTTHP